MDINGIEIIVETEDTENGKLVHGSRSLRWHLVGKNDRDYSTAIDPKDFEEYGEAWAMARYYSY